jgi:hypothetical protein
LKEIKVVVFLVEQILTSENTAFFGQTRQGISVNTHGVVSFFGGRNRFLKLIPVERTNFYERVSFCVSFLKETNQFVRGSKFFWSSPKWNRPIFLYARGFVDQFSKEETKILGGRKFFGQIPRERDQYL